MVGVIDTSLLLKVLALILVGNFSQPLQIDFGEECVAVKFVVNLSQKELATFSVSRIDHLQLVDLCQEGRENVIQFT